jgi:membrane protease YdiL (CAAX protease family)
MAPTWVQRNPLTAYFLLAFAGTWLLFLPVILARGLSLFPMEEPYVSLFLMGGVIFGPLVSSLIVTGLTEGRIGLKTFLRRIVQIRVGLVWFLIVILGYPLMYLAGLLPVLGIERYMGLVQNLPAFFTVYLPVLAISVIFPSLGEEPGWRGFALPRLQQRYGPLTGTLILGTLVAVWHLPIYFIPGFTTLDASDPFSILVQSGALVSAAFLITWLYNHGRQSIFFAMLIHAASNSSPTLVKALLGPVPSDPVFQLILLGSIALLLILFTKGRLSYKDDQKENLNRG